MAKYAKIGQVTDVLSCIEEAFETLEKKNQEEKLTEEDIRLRQIIHQGRDEFVDYICRGLQLKLKKKIGPQADIGKEVGLQLSRAAFAVMIKYSGFLSIFEEMHLEVDAEMMIGTSEENQ